MKHFFIVLTVILAFLVVPMLEYYNQYLLAFAHETECPEVIEPEAPEWVDFAGGRYVIGIDDLGEYNNALVIEPNQPMIADRFASYGNIITDPISKQRSPNLKTKDKVTAPGLEIYDMLVRMTQESGFFVFQVVAMTHDRVTLVKYTRIKWDDYLKQTLKAFE